MKLIFRSIKGRFFVLSFTFTACFNAQIVYAQVPVPAKETFPREAEFERKRESLSAALTKCKNACITSQPAPPKGTAGTVEPSSKPAKAPDCGCEKKYEDQLKEVNKEYTAAKKKWEGTPPKISVAKTPAGSKYVLLPNIPAKINKKVAFVLDADINTLKVWSEGMPSNMVTGMNKEQKEQFGVFVNSVKGYKQCMEFCFSLLSTGLIGAGYLDTHKIVFDETDKYYRENVLLNPDLIYSNNYNQTFTTGMINKVTASYAIFKMMEKDASYDKASKRKLLDYSLANAELIYEKSSYKELVQARANLIAEIQKKIATL